MLCASPAYLAAGKMAADFVLHGLTATGQSLFRIPLPARGHAAAAHPELPQAVACADAAIRSLAVRALARAQQRLRDMTLQQARQRMGPDDRGFGVDARQFGGMRVAPHSQNMPPDAHPVAHVTGESRSGGE